MYSLVSPLFEGEMIYFCLRPNVTPPVGFFLRLIKRSHILEPVTLGVSVKHFGISANRRPDKGLQVGETTLT